MSDSEKLDRIARLLEEIRDSQRTQAERQAESLAMQKEQFQLVVRQHEKAMKLQDRAEAIQEKSARLVRGVRVFVPFAITVVVILILYLTWLLLRIWR